MDVCAINSLDEKVLDEKYNALLALLKTKGSAAVAFSGGVDSSFLCHAARQALGDAAIAVTVVSPMLPKTEIDAARRLAQFCGIRHFLIEEDEIDDGVAANPKDRCYHCKKLEFGAIKAEAEKHGVAVVLDGSNMDDMADYRPGLVALSELRICSPLRDAGLAKDEIRALSRRFALPTWDKPAFACLASRIPYGEKITRGKLARIEKAEEVLRIEGFRQFRVRSHGELARIEVAPEERSRLFDEAVLDRMGETIKKLGFLYVAFEAQGYKTGSLNRALAPQNQGVSV
jgi:uncharacterized protein